MKSSRISAFLASIIISSGALANPTGGVVSAGDAVITQTPGNTVVQQNSQQAIINWQTFNIGAGEKTHFQQPQGGIVLNRVNATQGPSQIYGQLTANGKIILVNQAGIFFGPGSYVNVGAIIASTSNITDENFLAGKLIFDQPSLYNGSVINKGTIIAAQNGLVALLGANVTNDGMIQAQMGNVVLASGNKFTIDLYGDQLINFAIDEGITAPGVDETGKKLNTGVTNSGTILADGGKILMTAKAASGVLDHVINMSGVAQARSVDQKNGAIILSSDAPGTVLVSGLLDASGLMANQSGGKVKVLGEQILLANTAKVDVSGDTSGGEILIGGNYQGKGPEQNALATIVMPGSNLLANAITNGNGGRVIVWANDSTQFYGNISAKGGALGGNGGFVETSGHYLTITSAKVDLSAAQGATGTWLLDPTDLTICSACTTNTNIEPNFYSSTSTNSNLLVSDLETALATASVIVQTTSSGTGGNGDIIVNDPITWATANDLTLTAYRDITVNANITNTGGASVYLIADNTGTGTGTVNEFNNSSNVSLSGGSGLVRIFYNPDTFGVPTPTSSFYTGGTTPIAFQLINSLGTDSDASTDRTLGALSNPANSSLWSQNFALSKNIDASDTTTWNGGAGFSPIGNASALFTGSFSGQGYAINNLYINSTDGAVGGNLIGFFGLVFGSGSNRIENLGLTNANITGISTSNVADVGILAGFLYSTIVSNVYTSGTVSAGSATTAQAYGAGGLIGVSSISTISDSYSTANISSPNTYNMGGLIGYNDLSTFDNTYATGSVSVGNPSGSNIGGLIGYLNGGASGTVSHSYSEGAVTPINPIDGNSGGLIGSGSGGILNNNYWNTTTSGQSTSYLEGAGATEGLTTPQMETQSNFNGWDFTNTWGIIENNTAPYLLSLQRAVTGTATSDPGNIVSIVVNGTALATATTGTGGAYYFVLDRNTIPDTSHALIYLSGSATKGNSVIMAPTGGSSISGLDITADQISVYTPGVSNSILVSTKGAQTSSDILYSGSGSLLSLNNSTLATIGSSTNYVLDGSIEVGSGTTSINFAGPISITSVANITTTGAQTYHDAVTLLANALFMSTGSGAIDFVGAIDGAADLGVNTAGTTTFDNTVGNSTPLTSLTINSNGNTVINGGSIITSGSQFYFNDITLGTGTSLTTGGDITLNNIAGGGNSLNIVGSAGSNNFTFNGSTSGISSFSVDGGSAGTDIINFASQITAKNITLSSLGGTQGFAGTTDYSNLSFNNITGLIGGSASNYLTGLNTAGTWDISATNTGSYTSTNTLYFFNFQNLTGGTSGVSTFNFAIGSSITGTIDGGNSGGVNQINLSDNAEIQLASLTSGTVKNASNHANIATFNLINQATGLGATGSITLPTDKTYTVTYYDAALTSGEIGDPFYFFNMAINGYDPAPTPTPAPAPTNDVIIPTNTTNVMVSTNPNSNDFIGDSKNNLTGNIPTGVSANVDTIVEQVAAFDLETKQQQSFGCFSVQ